jgi:RNAse (barnase) inhibitor barstar
MKTDLFRLIDSRAGGVCRCHAQIPDRDLESATQRRMHVVQVNLAAARDKNTFLNTLAGALQFPAYFGHNWDAFYDCLVEFAHSESEGTLLVLREASGFARAEPEEFAAAVDTLSDAADYWKDEGKALLTVVELDTPALAPELAEISCPAT